MFLYRREPRNVAESFGSDVSKFEGEIVPVIFSVSFRDPGGYFLATKVQMRHLDVLFVANAQSVEVTKFLQFLQGDHVDHQQAAACSCARISR